MLLEVEDDNIGYDQRIVRQNGYYRRIQKSNWQRFFLIIMCLISWMCRKQYLNGICRNLLYEIWKILSLRLARTSLSSVRSIVYRSKSTIIDWFAVLPQRSFMSCGVWTKNRRIQAGVVGKINLYLEALDREVKKDNENPSVGVILCASKDDEVVEFALGRSLSPTMVSEYNLKLIDKKLLQKKLKEYIELAGTASDDE